MKNLNKAKVTPHKFLDSVINIKKDDNKKRLEKLENNINKRFDEFTYKAEHNTLHTLAKKWNYNKDDKLSDGYFLYHQYDNSESCITTLRAEIIKGNADEIVLTCPICGIRDATDLDHYIPRQLFPEFSIHPHNLIPTCHQCNNKKSTCWCEPQGNNRIIFNAYYDTITDENLFTSNIIIENNFPKILLEFDKFTTPLKESTRIAISTINQLELLPLFNQHINKKLAHEINRLKYEKKYFAKSTEDFITFIIDTYTEMAEDIRDINSLDKILYTLIAQNKMLLQWIKTYI